MPVWLFRYAVALCTVGILAALVGGGDAGIGSVIDRSDQAAPTTTTSTTTTTTIPSLFPLLSEEQVRAVRTPSGLVLPVLSRSTGGWEVVTPCENTAVVQGEPVHGAHVVLDPGHGGSEPGAVGPSGLTEKELNLDVALRVQALLEAEGATVVLTRSSDVRVTLAARSLLATSLQPLAFLSIHHNAAPVAVGPRPGSELYHQLESPQSRRLAGLLWEELQEHLSPFATEWAIGHAPGAVARQSARTGDDYYGVLRRTEGVAAVLVEASFLSSPNEDVLLRTPAFRDAEARAIADAVVRLVATPDPGSGYRPTQVSDTPAGGGGGSTGCVDPPLS